jgi:hypothetical protein
MAKTKSTRALRRTPTVADRIDLIRMDLIGVRACLVTTQAVLQGRPGLDGEVGTNLIRGGLLPLESAMAQLETLENRGVRS